MIKTYEAKLAEFGIPVEEMGFEPLLPVNEVKTVNNNTIQQMNVSRNNGNNNTNSNINNISLNINNIGAH